MIRDTLAKTAQALDVASLVENVAADDVVNQACYSAFLAARPFVRQVEQNSGAKSPKGVLNAFSNQ